MDEAGSGALTDRVAIVTGGARGLGEAYARVLSAEGAHVVIADLLEDDGQALARELGPRASFARLDVTRPQEWQVLTSDIVERLGVPYVLINNAGVVHRVDVACEDLDEWSQAWDDTIATNLLGPALLTWHALRVMGPGGRIVNVTSRAAFRGMPDSIPYAASKAAVAAMSQSLAQAVAGRGIAVTAVAPGYVETDMGRIALDGPQGDAIRQQSPFGRVATADEVAQAIVYLASPSAEWAAGAILDLNGASHLRM